MIIMDTKMKISVVVPEYKGATMLGMLLARLDKALSTISENYEVILVNDCSPDNVWEEIKQYAAKDKRIVGLNLSKNYGEHYAISAGLKYAKGEWVVVMDCDLEFRSKEFIEIIKNILSQSIEEANGGALVSFESKEPRYSYAAVDKDGYVTRTAEKEVISNHALCGAYFFSKGRRFKQVAHQLLNEPEFKKPEYYVSLLYNYLLAEGEKVQLATMEEYYSYGTPEELKRYL